MAEVGVLSWAPASTYGLGKERKEALAIPTHKDGVARLRLTERDREIDTNNSEKRSGSFAVINPVVKFDDSLRINAGYVWCQPHVPSYSWLLIADFPTKQVVQQGIVTPKYCDSVARTGLGDLCQTADMVGET